MALRRLIATAGGYLARVYVLGFALGAARERLAVRRYGRTVATAGEGVLMAAATYAAARRAACGTSAGGERLAVGGLALAGLVPLELAGARFARGLSPAQYLRTQRTPAGAIFAALVAWFAVAPFVAGLRDVTANAEERLRPLAGDDRIAAPIDSWTNAVTIRAPRASVWPWLVQMGGGRGGWYSYDRLDNAGRRSANGVDPALQHVAAGDIFPALPGTTDAFTVLDLDPERALVLGYVPPNSAQPLTTWSFILDEHPAGTRLLVRVRASAGYTFFGLPRPIARAVIGLVHEIMQAKQLRTIAARVEAYEKERATAGS